MIRAVDINADSRMRGPLIRKMVRDENYLERHYSGNGYTPWACVGGTRGRAGQGSGDR